jgi:sodium-independent sulfate anion transporter 11
MGLQRRAKKTIGHHIGEYLAGLIPIAKWLPKYDLAKVYSNNPSLNTSDHVFLLSQAQSDLIAGLTVGLMVVPQALAYASIAGLPDEVRLLSCRLEELT